MGSGRIRSSLARKAISDWLASVVHADRMDARRLWHPEDRAAAGPGGSQRQLQGGKLRGVVGVFAVPCEPIGRRADQIGVLAGDGLVGTVGGNHTEVYVFHL